MIKRYREITGMSVRELSRKLGYKGHSMINKIENGTKPASREFIKRFRELLKDDERDMIADGKVAVSSTTTERETALRKVYHYVVSMMYLTKGEWSDIFEFVIDHFPDKFVYENYMYDNQKFENRGRYDRKKPAQRRGAYHKFKEYV